MSSLPEGVFSLCEDSLTAVTMAGVPFPSPCPPGQLARNAPVSGQAYCERNQATGLEALFVESGGDSNWTTEGKTGWPSAASGTWDPCIAIPEGGESTWHGVTCGSGSSSGRVVELQLLGIGMVNALPTGALASLSSLVVLDLSLNSKVTGTIDGLEPLVELTRLSLASMKLSGSIALVGGMPRLEILQLEANSFSEGFEAVRSLSLLTELAVGDNSFCDTLDAVAGLVNLVSLDVRGCGCSGTLEPLAELSKLEVLLVQNNNLNGDLSPLQGLLAMERMSIGWNNLTGSVDAALASPLLQKATLDGNPFSGVLRGELLAPLPLLTLRLTDTGVEAISGHAPLPASMVKL